MHHERLILGVAATLGTIALVLTLVGITGSPLALPVAAAFAASALLMYDQLSGRMAARVYDRVERAARVNGAADAGGSSQRRSRRERQRRGRRRARDDDRDGHRGDAGAGPREEWRPPRDGATAREAAAAQGAAGRRTAGRGRRSRAGRAPSGGRSAGANRSVDGQPGEDRMPAAVAYRKLGLDPGADDEAVKQAYREKVKEVHPDTGDGDEDEFMAVKEAYERLRD